MPAKCSELIQAVGTFSGHDVDKFSAFDMKYEQGLKADIPVLTEAYFAYECRTMNITTYGDHEWIAGEILQCYRDPDCFLENGLVDLSELEIPLYLGRSTYRTLDQNSVEKDHPLYLNK